MGVPVRRGRDVRGSEVLGCRRGGLGNRTPPGPRPLGAWRHRQPAWNRVRKRKGREGAAPRSKAGAVGAPEGCRAGRDPAPHALGRGSPAPSCPAGSPRRASPLRRPESSGFRRLSTGSSGARSSWHLWGVLSGSCKEAPAAPVGSGRSECPQRGERTRSPARPSSGHGSDMAAALVTGLPGVGAVGQTALGRLLGSRASGRVR